MITAKEARKRRNSDTKAVTDALDELNMAIQFACASKSRIDFRTTKLTESERDVLRDKLISFGYNAFIVDEKIEVSWE